MGEHTFPKMLEMCLDRSVHAYKLCNCNAPLLPHIVIHRYSFFVVARTNARDQKFLAFCDEAACHSATDLVAIATCLAIAYPCNFTANATFSRLQLWCGRIKNEVLDACSHNSRC